MTTSSLQHNYVKDLLRYTLMIRSLHKYIIYEDVCLCKLTVELLIIISILTLGAIADIFLNSICLAHKSILKTV